MGFTPDMIDDDLPTNPNYLVESFGAPAGLLEFSEDEMVGESTDEGEMSESMLDSHVVFQDPPDMSASTPQAAASDEDPQKHGGETIKMLVPEGIHVIEDYFETLEPDPLLSVDAE